MTTVFEAAGGDIGLLDLARAWHARVMADEVVSHAFSHGFHPDHTERLAAYWAEALGGPSMYSAAYGNQSSVVKMHSGNGPHQEMDHRAINCFDQALADVGLDDDDRVRQLLFDYFRGRPPRQCRVTTAPQTMCRTVCESPTGPGKALSPIEPRGRPLGDYVEEARPGTNEVAIVRSAVVSITNSAGCDRRRSAVDRGPGQSMGQEYS